MINITKRIIFQALERGPHALIIIDAQKPGLPVAYVNPAFEALTGLDSTALIGSGLTELVPGSDLSELEKAGTGGWIANDGIRLRQRWRVKSGQPIPVEVHLSALYQNPGRPAYWLLTQVHEPVEGRVAPSREAALRVALRDVRQQLKYLERSDPVTGIPNHKVFTEALQRDWDIACREQKRLAMILFKIDALDEYRNLFGRHSTDSMLRMIGHAIAGSLRRSGDLGARLNQDRFAVLIGSADEDQAILLAERIQSKVRRLAIHHPRSPKRFVTVSFGIASEVPGRIDAATSLLEQAEGQLSSTVLANKDSDAGTAVSR